MRMKAWIDQIQNDGYAIVPGVLASEDADAIIGGVTPVLHHADEAAGSLRSGDGAIFAARNVLDLWPEAAKVWRRAPIPDLLTSMLGSRYGLVRILFFDKPPEKTWSLPWHKDLTIAVKDNRIRSRHFVRPTRKAGVPHVEAPLDVLENMLTVRIHLDKVTGENGPMRVLPGTHRSGKRPVAGAEPARDILVDRGDVLFFRPLLTHGSAPSRDGTDRHRRVLHLEFAASEVLPDGYRWHDFIPGIEAASENGVSSSPVDIRSRRRPEVA
jgi:hypothetical protein